MTLGFNGAIKEAARARLGVSPFSRLAVALKLETWLLAAFPVAANPPRRWFVHSADVGPERPLVDEFVAFVIAPYARGDRALARLG